MGARLSTAQHAQQKIIDWAACPRWQRGQETKQTVFNGIGQVNNEWCSRANVDITETGRPWQRDLDTT
jgi:hypothetical protein